MDDDETLMTSTSSSEPHRGTGEQRRVVKVHRVDTTDLNESTNGHQSQDAADRLISMPGRAKVGPRRRDNLSDVTSVERRRRGVLTTL